MNFFYDNNENRVGDEIQMTAVIQYFKLKVPEYEIWYRDRNHFISAQNLFPKDMVKWVDKKDENSIPLITKNLWIWAPLLRSRGIYTKLIDVVNPNPPMDIIFAPLISPRYNYPREFDARFSIECFKKLRQVYPNTYMLLDASKFTDLGELHSDNIILCKTFYQAFKYIQDCKIFIGGDTGTTHYAGAIKHPNIIACYPDMEHSRQSFKWENDVMAKLFDEPDFLNPEFYWDSRPDCPPENMTTLYLNKNTLDMKLLLETVKNKFS